MKLDESPYRDYHQITVYHPYEEIPFINIGWSGMIGLITGINEYKLTASTIYVNYPDRNGQKIMTHNL